LGKAFSLVAYSFTPALLGGIFCIYPKLSWLAPLALLYGLYLFYIGVEPIMKPLEEKKSTYSIVSVGCLVAVYFVLGSIMASVFDVPYRLFLWGSIGSGY
jgi:Na+-translocating ferredoxin:NAD+ oxidoreductase RnfD subunit